MAKKSETQLGLSVQVEKKQEDIKPEETEPTKAKLWKAEVTFPFQIRVPIDIAIQIGERTVLVSSADQDLPKALVNWLGHPFSEHRNKLA